MEKIANTILHQPDVENLGGLVMAEAVVEERGVLSAEFINERDQFYRDVPKDKEVVTTCSDDRPITPESEATIAVEYPEALPIGKGTSRLFGGREGRAKMVMVVGLATNPDFAKMVGGMDGLMGQLDAFERRRAKSISLLHTDAAKEGQPNQLAADKLAADGTPAPLGCAHAMGSGAVSNLTVNNPAVRTFAIERQAAIYSNPHTDQLLAGHEAFLETFGADYAFDRTACARLGDPVVVLAGIPHKAVADTGVLLNFTNQIASPTEAHEAGKDFYSVDVVREVNALQKIFPEYGLDPQLLAEALTLEAYAVCAVLDLHDSGHVGGPDNLDPARLATGVRGDVAAALATWR